MVWKQLLFALYTLLQLCSTQDTCVPVIETEFCKGLMPLKVCSSTPEPHRFTHLTGQSFEQQNKLRCPREPDLLTPEVYCYPRPECTTDTDCRPSTDPPLCYSQCLKGVKLKGLSLLPAARCYQNSTKHCDEHSGFTSSAVCTHVTAGRMKYTAVVLHLGPQALTVNTLDSAARAMLTERFAKVIRVRASRVHLMKVESRRNARVTMVVTQDEAIDRPCWNAMRRLHKLGETFLGPEFVVLGIIGPFEVPGLHSNAVGSDLGGGVPLTPAQFMLDSWYIWPSVSFGLVMCCFGMLWVHQGHQAQLNQHSYTRAPSGEDAGRSQKSHKVEYAHFPDTGRPSDKVEHVHDHFPDTGRPSDKVEYAHFPETDL